MVMSRRDEVIAAATELFAQYGFHAVGMRAIADAVGIRGSSIYHHFPSKLDLLHAIALDSTQTFIETQLPSLDDSLPYAEQLRGLLHAHVVYFHEHRLEEAVGLRELQELRTNAPERYIAIQTIRRSYQDAIEGKIKAGMAKGEFTCPDARLATMAVLGMVNSVNDWFAEGGRLSIEEVAESFSSMAVDRILGAAH